MSKTPYLIISAILQYIIPSFLIGIFTGESEFFQIPFSRWGIFLVITFVIPVFLIILLIFRWLRFSKKLIFLKTLGISFLITLFVIGIFILPLAYLPYDSQVMKFLENFLGAYETENFIILIFLIPAALILNPSASLIYAIVIKKFNESRQADQEMSF